MAAAEWATLQITMHNSYPAPPHEKRTFSVPPEEVGQRLDRYLTTMLSDISRTEVQRLITDGSILVNGRSSKPGYALRFGDELCVILNTSKPALYKLKPQPIPLDIIYEDSDLLVVNKAAGMVVHPAPGHYDDTLVNAL